MKLPSVRRIVAATSVLALVAFPALVGSTAAEAAASAPAGQMTRAEFGPDAHHDLSKPLRDIPGKAVGNPHKDNGPEPQLPHPPASPVGDPVVQTAPVASLAPTSNSFDGLGVGFTGPSGTFSFSGTPSDDNAAVSTTQIVQTVNTQLAVFNKSGTALYGPVNINTLFTGFGGSCETTNDGDPVVRYDRTADRWVISQFANVRSSVGPYYECVAVSQTNDATGAYYRYAFQYSAFPDYPKMSVWPDAYYTTFNMFPNNTFNGAKVCAYDRSKMLTGAAATQQCFNTTTSYGGLLGGDQDSSTAPPAGTPELLVSLGTTSSSLAYWKFHVDWTNTANTTVTGPNSLTVAGYTTLCNATGTCVPQASSTQQLDSLGDRMMFRLAYRNFGDHEAYVVDHSVAAGTSGGVRWYELRPDSLGNPSVYQQGTYAPDSTYRWMGSIAQDKAGNIGLGFSTSSSSANPGLHYTGRLATDTTLGTMTQGEGSFIDGPGAQTTLSRWGDYTSMVTDPSDDCTFWYTGEYLPNTGYQNWHTRIGSFQLPGCGTPPPPPPAGGITNGGFETGNLTGWTGSGAAYGVSTAAAHTGSYGAMLGSTSPTNGDSNIAQTFTAPTGTSKLSFWSKIICPDTLTYDWATATLKDNTTNTTTTVLPKTCSNTGLWNQTTASVVAGHSYTLTLTSHDDNYPGDATYTYYDDVTLS